MAKDVLDDFDAAVAFAIGRIHAIPFRIMSGIAAALAETIVCIETNRDRARQQDAAYRAEVVKFNDRLRQET